MQRATQGTILLYAYDPVTGAPAAGLASNAVTVCISKDGATPTQTTNSVSEVDATHQKGWYSLTLTSTETDCGSALITATHATAKFATSVVEFAPSDYATASGLSALQTHGDSTWATASVPTSDIAAIKAKTDNLPLSPAATGDAMTLTSVYDAAKTPVDVGASLTAYGAAKTSDIPSVADIAESVLAADVSAATVSATPDSLAGVILAMFHSAIGTDGTWMIYKGDDTTPFAVKTVLPSANATPIVGVANSEG